jgi:hypothetical protein
LPRLSTHRLHRIAAIIGVLGVPIFSIAPRVNAAQKTLLPNIVVILADDKAYNEAVPRGSNGHW